MPSTMTRDTFQTAQERGFADLLKELIAKINTRFSDLEQKTQEKFTQAAREVEKLDDDVNRVRSQYAERFHALAEHHHRGGDYRGPFADAQQARAFGTLVAALGGAPWAREALADDRHLAAVQGMPGSSGGFLLPEGLVPGIINNAEKHGVFERNARKWPAAGESASRVTRTSGATVYYPDYGVVPSESTLSFGRVRVELTKYAAYAAADRWMLSSPALAIPLGNYIAEELAYAAALAMDTNAFMGTGGATHAKTTGLFKSAGGADVTADSGHNTFEEVIDANVSYLSKLIGNLPDSADDENCKFYLHRSIFWRYLGARDSANRPIADIITKGERPQRVLMGYPAEVAQVAPKLADSAESTALLILANLMRGADLHRNENAVGLLVSEHVKMLEGQVVFLLEMLQGTAIADATMYGRLLTAAA
ncbi:MAG: phage major capsid protein [Phycisphaerae bacterium]|jgi:HK97 family phage major capsid protein